MTTPQEVYDDIKDQVANWENHELCDPALGPDLLTAALIAIRELADDGIVVDDSGADHRVPLAQEWAWRLLLAMQHRAVTGIPFDEPQEVGAVTLRCDCGYDGDPIVFGECHTCSRESEAPAIPPERPWERVLSDGDGDLG